MEKRLLKAFIRRARRRYPKEYIEELFGKKIEGGFEVLLFREIDHKATRGQLEILDDVDPKERVGNLVRLGTIHSHPDRIDSIPSEHDWCHQREDSERIAGICALYQKGGKIRSSVKFYLANAMMDTEMR